MVRFFETNFWTWVSCSRIASSSGVKTTTGKRRRSCDSDAVLDGIQYRSPQYRLDRAAVFPGCVSVFRPDRERDLHRAEDLHNVLLLHAGEPGVLPPVSHWPVVSQHGL